MAKITSAEAAKILKKLKEELGMVSDMEERTSTYVVALGEDPESLRPDYDYVNTSLKIESLEAKIRLLKHAINIFNINTVVPEINMTIDQTLVYIPQLRSRCEYLGRMMKKLPKERFNSGYSRGSSIIEYLYVNYDIEEVKKDYNKCKSELNKVLVQLDLVNSTLQMEVDDSILE